MRFTEFFHVRANGDGWRYIEQLGKPSWMKKEETAAKATVSNPPLSEADQS